MPEGVSETPPTIENDHAVEQHAIDCDLDEDCSCEQPASESDSSGTLFGLPVDMFVKGGTTTTAHDRLMAEQEADAERRRAEADEEKRKAKAFGLASGNPNEVATQYHHEFTDHPEIRKAYVPLQYMGRGGKEVEHVGVGDITMVHDPKFPNELALLLYCPKCKERGLPASQCILTVRQANRKWELDTRPGRENGAGSLFIDPDGIAQRSAGVIMDSERFTCARCSWSACVDNNRVIPR